MTLPWRRRTSSSDAGLADEARSEGNHFFYVRIPGDIQPIERGDRFEDPLEAALQEAALGLVTAVALGLRTTTCKSRVTVHAISFFVRATGTSDIVHYGNRRSRLSGKAFGRQPLSW